MRRTIMGIILILIFSIFVWLYSRESIASVFVSMAPFLLCVLVDYRTRLKLTNDEYKCLCKKKAGFIANFLIIFLGFVGIPILLGLMGTKLGTIKGTNDFLIGIYCIGLGYLGLVLGISVAYKK